MEGCEEKRPRHSGEVTRQIASGTLDRPFDTHGFEVVRTHMEKLFSGSQGAELRVDEADEGAVDTKDRELDGGREGDREVTHDREYPLLVQISLRVPEPARVMEEI